VEDADEIGGQIADGDDLVPAMVLAGDDTGLNAR
jgi:hypothetical protein